MNAVTVRNYPLTTMRDILQFENNCILTVHEETAEDLTRKNGWFILCGWEILIITEILIIVACEFISKMLHTCLP